VPRARGRSDRPRRRRASPMGRARLRRGRLRLKSASRRGESPSPGVARGCVPSGARLQPAPLARAAHMRRRPAFGQDVVAPPVRTAAKVAGFPGPQGRDPPSPRSNGALLRAAGSALSRVERSSGGTGLCTGAARRPRARTGTLGCSGSRSGRRQPCMRATVPYAAQAPPSNRTTGRRLLSQRGQSSPGARRSSARRRRILTDRRWTLGGSFGSSHPLFARGRGSSPPVGRRSNGARAGNRTTATAHAARPTARTRVDALPRHCAQVESSERESES